MHCPLCLKEKNEPYYHNKVRSYQRCLVCDLVFVPSNYFLSENDEKARYNLHQNNSNDDGYKQFLSQLLTPMLSHLKSGDEGLDFGSGPEPALAELFRSHQFHVTLYDPFFANTPQVLNRQYNFITASEVIEHLYNPAVVFEQLSQMLNTGGVLGVMTKTQVPKPNFPGWWYKNDPTHVCFYSEATFAWIQQKWKLNIEYRKGDVTIFSKQ